MRKITSINFAFSTHPGMNERSSRLDDDGDLIVVAVTELVEGRHLIMQTW
jgi:hypothetical protein